jgi:hypothetical protein
MSQAAEKKSYGDEKMDARDPRARLASAKQLSKLASGKKKPTIPPIGKRRRRLPSTDIAGAPPTLHNVRARARYFFFTVLFSSFLFFCFQRVDLLDAVPRDQGGRQGGRQPRDPLDERLSRPNSFL